MTVTASKCDDPLMPGNVGQGMELGCDTCGTVVPMMLVSSSKREIPRQRELITIARCQEPSMNSKLLRPTQQVLPQEERRTLPPGDSTPCFLVGH